MSYSVDSVCVCGCLSVSVDFRRDMSVYVGLYCFMSVYFDFCRLESISINCCSLDTQEEGGKLAFSWCSVPSNSRGEGSRNATMAIVRAGVFGSRCRRLRAAHARVAGTHVLRRCVGVNTCHVLECPVGCPWQGAATGQPVVNKG